MNLPAVQAAARRYGAAVDTCLECGNSDLRVRLLDGLPVHECALCGARSGDPEAVARLDEEDEAQERGVPREIHGLVRALERLPGLAVRDASAGDAARRTLPYLELSLHGPMALSQLENLTKSLVLGAGSLRRHWVLEVEYLRHLAFLLKPRHLGGAISAQQVEDARADLDVLRRNLERDAGLGWWLRS